MNGKQFTRQEGEIMAGEAARNASELPDLSVDQITEKRIQDSEWIANIVVRASPDSDRADTIAWHGSVTTMIGDRLAGRRPLPAVVGAFVMASFVVESNDVGERSMVQRFAEAVGSLVNAEGPDAASSSIERVVLAKTIEEEAPRRELEKPNHLRLVK